MRPLLLALLLPLAGCVSLGPKVPPTLMTLSPASPIAAGAARSATDAQAVAVAIPNVAPGLSTQRVAVSAGPNAVAYLKDAQWVGAPAMLFRNLLAETITSRTGRVVPDVRQLAVQADTRLSGTLAKFGLDGPGGAAEIVYDATITRTGRDAIQARRFVARVPVAVQDGPSVAAALNQASNQVATEVADWIGAQ